MNKVFAQQDLGTIGGTGLGPFGEISGEVEGLAAVTDTISAIIGIMTIGGGIWFIFQLITAGISWVSSGGDKAKLETVRSKMIHAFVGLVIVVAGWAIISLSGEFLGYNPLDLNAILNIR